MLIVGFFIGFSQNIYLQFWIKPVNSNKMLPLAKALAIHFRQLFFLK